VITATLSAADHDISISYSTRGVKDIESGAFESAAVTAVSIPG
jgi:hypothetical protein